MKRTLAILVTSLLASCASTPHKAATPPAAIAIKWEHNLPMATDKQWVVFRIKVDAATGNLQDIDAVKTENAAECLNLAAQAPDFKATLPLVELRVCRHLAADGTPLDDEPNSQDKTDKSSVTL